MRVWLVWHLWCGGGQASACELAVLVFDPSSMESLDYVIGLQVRRCVMFQAKVVLGERTVRMVMRTILRTRYSTVESAWFGMLPKRLTWYLAPAAGVGGTRFGVNDKNKECSQLVV